MSGPVQMSDLDLTTTAADADLALIRKSDTTDYKVTVQVLRNINVGGLPFLPRPYLEASDLFIVSVLGVNCQCAFGTIGVTKGTKMWFYGGAVPVAPLYWQIVPGTSDTLLGVRGGAIYTTGGNVQGNWQQRDVGGVANQGLTIQQIPNHAHRFELGDNSATTKNVLPRGARDEFATSQSGITYGINGRGSASMGSCDPHNHGNNWRPLASVGLICEKRT